MNVNLPKDICDILVKSLNGNWDHFDVTVHRENDKGGGCLGEIKFLSLKNKSTGEDVHLVIKQVFPTSSQNSMDLMSWTFFNEIHIYSKLMPAMIEFQKLFLGSEVFNFLPKCYATSSEPRKQKLVLENLNFKDYQTHPQSVPLGPKQFEFIFKIYGKLHGLGYAFKFHEPKTFLELVTPLKNSWSRMISSNMMKDILTRVIERVHNFLEQNGEKQIAQIMQKYIKDGISIYRTSVNYTGKYPVLIHGDCWSNNIMIKYNATGDIEDIKLIDWQVSDYLSPVYDLSYCFYTAANKESLDNLEYLLKIYHNSLTATLKQLKCNPEEIYPFEELKKEWKEHCIFGYLNGLILWNMKSIEDFSHMPKIDDREIYNADVVERLLQVNFLKFKERALDLTKHMHLMGFL